MSLSHLSLRDLPLDWLLLGGLAIALASTLGFVCGLLSARWSDRRAELRSRTGLRRVYETVLGQLDRTASLCRVLDGYDGRSLTVDQTDHLARRQDGLLQTLTRIINRQRGIAEYVKESNAPPLVFEPLKVRWTMQPVHHVSGLPDREAFEASLKSLIDAGAKSGQRSHLLLIRIDRLPSLVSRYGQAGIHALLRKLASVVCRTIRDDDLVCQIGPDQLAVLLAGTDTETARRLSTAARDAVRSHRFHVNETGPEILLTASFGLGVCLPDDRPELVIDRATSALNSSQRLGRNQLHLHDGIALLHCALSA